MIKEEVQSHSKSVDYNAKDIRPSPLETSVLKECPCNWRPKNSEGDRGG